MEQLVQDLLEERARAGLGLGLGLVLFSELALLIHLLQFLPDVGITEHALEADFAALLLSLHLVLIEERRGDPRRFLARLEL